MSEQIKYPWYQTISDASVCQGDILPNFNVVIPDQEGTGETVSAQLRTLDVVIMTQTCDIINGKVESLLLCPCWDLKKFVEAALAKHLDWGKKQREELRRGNLPGYYLANEADQDGIAIGLTIIDFHEVYSAPTKVVYNFISKPGKRLRLLPPYREQLAQAFARFFMRVGLPVDIPPEKLKNLSVKPKTLPAAVSAN